MPTMTSQILNSVDFTKTQRSRYLENEILFFLQIKKLLLFIKGHFVAKNSFVAEVTFKYHSLVLEEAKTKHKNRSPDKQHLDTS